jgi:uncharacterized protein (TIGR02145 family)
MTLHAQWVEHYSGGEPCPGTPHVVDIDGNTYRTVQIGSQCWTRENLKTTKFNTGEKIPVISDYSQWCTTTTPAMCYYDNNIGYAAKYGALYNGYAARNGNLCPEGWRVPSDTDWEILTYHLGGYDVAGYKMKTVYDWAEDGNGSNESGFSALPAGKRDIYNDYNELESSTGFWTSTNKYYRDLSYDTEALSLFSTFIVEGYSVRCVKD